jgi:hypothetical protein
LTLSSSDGSINANSNFEVAGSSGNTTIAGRVSITNDTDASSSTDNDASLNTDGGGAIAKKLYVGGEITGSDGLTISSSGASISGGLTVSGGISASGQTVTADTFTGTAAQADACKVEGLGDDSGPHFITLINGTDSSGYKSMRVDSGLHYNSDNNTLTVSGDIIAFGSAASDDRLKTNRITIENALEKVGSLSGFTFDWNEKAAEILNFPLNTRQIGVSAQEVQSILPEAVRVEKTLESDEEFLMVRYEKLVPLLVEAIKELTQKVETLEQKLK